MSWPFRGLSREEFFEEFKLREGEDIDEHAYRLSSFLFHGVPRRTGEPYLNHIEEVHSITDDILKEGPYKKPSKAASKHHDSPEDHSDIIDVYNPFSPLPEWSKRQAAVYLNDLIESSGLYDEYTCYLVNKLTKRKWENYEDYLRGTFHFADNETMEKAHPFLVDSDLFGLGKPPEEIVLIMLNQISGVIKTGDRRSNGKPYEQRDTKNLVRKYLKLKDSSVDEQLRFLSGLKVKDYMFEIQGRDYRFSKDSFIRSLNFQMIDGAIATAQDNIYTVVPLVERKLVKPYWVDSNLLFDEKKLRNCLVDILVDSFKVIASLDHDHTNISRHVGKTIAYRGVKNPPGYISVLDEAQERFNKEF